MPEASLRFGAFEAGLSAGEEPLPPSLGGDNSPAERAAAAATMIGPDRHGDDVRRRLGHRAGR